jgi:glutathione S-transferase
MQFVDLAEAKQRPGLRLVTVGGIPSPWSEAAKGLFHVKKIPFVGVRLEPGRPEVPEWTGCHNAPVAMFDDEAPRSGWAEILLLAERLAPEPRLVPADPEQRALLFGLSHEICGEMGLGWARRLAGIHESLETNGERGFPVPAARYLAQKYGYRPDNGDEARQRVVDVLKLLAGRLHQSDGPWYLGGAPGAVDIYSATFMGLLAPLPPEHLQMPDALRKAFSLLDPETEKALDPILLEHRDRVYGDLLELPVTL